MLRELWIGLVVAAEFLAARPCGCAAIKHPFKVRVAWVGEVLVNARGLPVRVHAEE